MSNWSEALKKDTKKILGVVNITNDSFSNDGLLDHKEQLIKNLNSYSCMNIRFLDIGCVSTKPGYVEVSPKQYPSLGNVEIDHLMTYQGIL